MFDKANMDKTALVVATLAAACLLPATASAELSVKKGGVSLVPPPSNTGAVAPSEQASTIRDTKKAGGRTLRCWQAGRLLYEGTGFKPDADHPSNTVTVPRTDGDSVVLFDQKDSFCILSK